MAANQIPDSFPQSANAFPVDFVVPKDWGQFQMFKKTVTPDATLLLEGLQDKTGADVALPDQTFELTGILIQNFAVEAVWWGDGDVDPTWGHPIKAAAAADDPGYAMLTGVDPTAVYLAGPIGSSGIEVIITLFGKFDPAV